MDTLVQEGEIPSTDKFLKDIAEMCCDASDLLKGRHDQNLIDALLLLGKYMLISSIPENKGEIDILVTTCPEYCPLCMVHRTEIESDEAKCDSSCVLNSGLNDGYCTDSYAVVRQSAQDKGFLETAFNLQPYIKKLIRTYTENEL